MTYDDDTEYEPELEEGISSSEEETTQFSSSKVLTNHPQASVEVEREAVSSQINPVLF